MKQTIAFLIVVANRFICANHNYVSLGGVCRENRLHRAIYASNSLKIRENDVCNKFNSATLNPIFSTHHSHEVPLFLFCLSALEWFSITPTEWTSRICFCLVHLCFVRFWLQIFLFCVFFFFASKCLIMKIMFK